SIGEVQRGHSIERLSLDWDMVDGVPVTLGRYEVHPRSIGMVRAEEMRTFAGPFRMQPGSKPDEWVVDNQSEWELWDCQLIVGNSTISLGDLRPGDGVEIVGRAVSKRATVGDPKSLYDVHRSIEADGLNVGSSNVRELGDLSQLRMLALCRQNSLGLGLHDQ